MNAFNTIFALMQGGHINGHLLRNIQNVKSLAIANKEIEEMMGAK